MSDHIIGQFWADLYKDDKKVATLELSDGSVTQDFNAASRRTCQLTFPAWGVYSPEGGIIPEIKTGGRDQKFGELEFGTAGSIFGDSVYDYIESLVQPLRSSVKIYADYSASGGMSNVLLGTFTLGDPTWSATHGGVMASVSGWDTAANLAATRFDEVVTVGSGTNVVTAISSVLSSRYLPAGMSIALPSTAFTTAEVVYVPGCGVSPWRAAQEFADLAGWQLYVNRDATQVNAAVKPAPGAYPPASMIFSDRLNLFTADLASDTRELCNVVVVSGDTLSGDATWAVAENKTGPFGTLTTGKRLVREYSSDKAQSTSDCQQLANEYLRQWSRQAQTVTFTATPRPDVEAGQTVLVQSSDLGLNDDDVFFVESCEQPLNPTSPMTITASRRLR